MLSSVPCGYMMVLWGVDSTSLIRILSGSYPKDLMTVFSISSFDIAVFGFMDKTELL